MGTLKNIIEGTHLNNIINTPINLFDISYFATLITNKYEKNIPPLSRQFLVSDILLTNNIEQITKIMNMYSDDVRIRQFISYLLDTCEKWKFINIFNKIKKNLYFDNIEMDDFVYDYVDNAYIFDFSNLEIINKNCTIFTQLIFKNIMYINTSVSPVFTSTPTSSLTRIVKNNINLVLLECLEHYCPIIRAVSNPTDDDLIVYENPPINPFILGQKIRINKKIYTYKSCLGTKYYKCKSQHPYMCLVIKTNDTCWNVIFTNKHENKITYWDYILNKTMSIDDIEHIDSFECKLVNNNWIWFDPSNLVLDNANGTCRPVTSSKDYQKLFIGPKPVTSIMNMCMNSQKLIFDLTSYATRPSCFELNQEYIKLLRRVYNIPENMHIDINSTSIEKLIFKYPDVNFIKANNYFICTNNEHDKLDNIEEYYPNWDFLKIT